MVTVGNESSEVCVSMVWLLGAHNSRKGWEVIIRTRRLKESGDLGTMDLCDLTLPGWQGENTVWEQVFRTAAGEDKACLFSITRWSLRPSSSFFSLTCSLGLPRWGRNGRKESVNSGPGPKEQGFSGNCAKTTWGKPSCEREMYAQGEEETWFVKEALTPCPHCCLINEILALSKSSMDPIRTLFLFWTVTLVIIDTSWLGSITKNEVSIHLFRKVRQS